MWKTWQRHAAARTELSTLAPAPQSPAPSLLSSILLCPHWHWHLLVLPAVVLPPANGVKINLIECEMKFVLTHTHTHPYTHTHTAKGRQSVVQGRLAWIAVHSLAAFGCAFLLFPYRQHRRNNSHSLAAKCPFCYSFLSLPTPSPPDSL